MRFSYNLKQIVIAVVAIMVSGIVLYELIYILFHAHLAIGWVFLILAAIGFVGLYIPFAKEYMDGFRKGESGEVYIHRLLVNNLPGTYVSLHDLVLPGNKGNIDEVVISPQGVWTLEVKNSSHRGEITFTNEMLYINHAPLEGKGLKQAYREAKNLEEHMQASLGLSVPVHPVLVFANPNVKVRLGMHKARGVHVIGVGWLRTLLVSQNLPILLTPEQCVAVSDELKQYTSTL